MSLFRFFSTVKTKAPNLEVHGCRIRQLEVVRPVKSELADGDCVLTFNITVPANMEVWQYGYRNFGCTLAVAFEEMQMTIPSGKESETKAESEAQQYGQMKLGETPTDQSAPKEEAAASKKAAKGKKLEIVKK
jgi:hypothetical protein